MTSLKSKKPDTPPLLQSLQWLKGVGPKMAEKLAKLDLHCVQDLLFHLPLRYQDRTRISPIGALRPGVEITVTGEVTHTEVVYRRRRMLICQISDGTGSLQLRFFYFNDKQRKNWAPGTRLQCFGEVRAGASMLEMVHPEVSVVTSETADPVEASLTPIYPATDGVHQLTLRRLTDLALSHIDQLPDLLPADLLVMSSPSATFPSLIDAVLYLHRPPPDADVELMQTGQHPAQQKLAFEELLAHQLALRKLRLQADKNKAEALPPEGVLKQKFLASLPFQLTGAQQRVAVEVAQDLDQSSPMMRLVQGDVGSGKTVIAALACLQAVEAGFQAAVMAPTEILAEQHFQTLSAWFLPLGIKVAWLSGRLKAAVRREMLEKISSGDALVVVGTHALFQDDVKFYRLACVVIDEQHRFGVHQRLALREKGKQQNLYPHQLIMTATPIPRTLAQTAYADLDISVIDELPPGRTPVKTVVLTNDRRAEVVARVAKACRSGQQCYWVCTLVEESDLLEAEAAEKTCEMLQQALPDLKIGLVHGRLKADEKDQAMTAFKSRETALLVATTVIEVGVDVPNASLMVIENAERLGLSQLHQLRGRVGRGALASVCVLMYRRPLSENSQARLAAMRETTDGFKIAQIDMQIRGPGELLGTRQTGLLQFRVADIVRDKALIPEVTKIAAKLVQHQPQLIDPVVRRWTGTGSQFRVV